MELCEEATQLIYPVRFSKVQQDLQVCLFRLFHCNHTINAHYLQISFFFCLLIIKNTLILAHVWSAWPAVSLLLADAVCIKSLSGSYRSITFFVSQIATVLHKREPEDGETRVIHEDEATISAEECQGHLRDMPVIKDFLTKFTVWSVWQNNKTTSV